MKAIGKLSVIDMVEGVKYPVSELGRCKSSVCPCCGKAIAKHDFAVAVHDGSKRTTGFKCVVGVGCEPDAPKAPEQCETLALKWRLSRQNPDELKASIMRATANYTGRTVDIDKKNKYVTVTLFKSENEGCQKLGKLAYTISQYDKNVKMSINGSDWEPYDSAKVTDMLGVAGYRGEKVYGV